MEKEKAITLVVLGALIVILIALAIQDYIIIQNKGAIKTVNVNIFEDSQLTIPLIEIDWGFVEPGTSVTRVGYVVSDSNVNISLAMYTGNFTPTIAEPYLNLTWNCENITLNPYDWMMAVFELHISENVTGVMDFSFDVVIVGSEIE